MENLEFEINAPNDLLEEMFLTKKIKSKWNNLIRESKQKYLRK